MRFLDFTFPIQDCYSVNLLWLNLHNFLILTLMRKALWKTSWHVFLGKIFVTIKWFWWPLSYCVLPILATCINCRISLWESVLLYNIAEATVVENIHKSTAKLSRGTALGYCIYANPIYTNISIICRQHTIHHCEDSPSS